MKVPLALFRECDIWFKIFVCYFLPCGHHSHYFCAPQTAPLVLQTLIEAPQSHLMNNLPAPEAVPLT